MLSLRRILTRILQIRHLVIVSSSIVGAASLLASGCAHGSAMRTPRARATWSVPMEVTQDNYAEAVRTVHRMPLDDPHRHALREAIIKYIDLETAGLISSDDYASVLSHFGQMTSILYPEDFAPGHLPPNLKKPAEFLLSRGSPQGDESTVLSSLIVLEILSHDAQDLRRKYRDQYRMVASWSRQSRDTIDSEVDRINQLIEVWTKHSQLTPAPAVLNVLAGYYTERQKALAQALESGMSNSMSDVMSFRALQSIRPLLVRAPLDVAAVFLKHGDVSAAIAHVGAMGNTSGTEDRVLRVMRESQIAGKDGMNSLLELSEAFRLSRPDVALGLCRLGNRSFPEQAHFAICLARIGAAQEQYSDATAWYAEAINLAPTVRAIYDEALQQLDRLIEEDLFESQPSGTRDVVHHAERILDQRLRRWPNIPPPVARYQLDLLVGMLEMNAGNASQARARLQASIAAEPSSEALTQLGLLTYRTGDPREAVGLYKKALELLPQSTKEDMARRAELLENLGDTLRTSGNSEEATRVYQQALAFWDEGLSTVQGRELGVFYVRRGILLDRLGRHREAVDAFRATLTAAPPWREPYAQILAHLVVSEPEVELAQDVFRSAQRQVTLEPEWKVYFSLWTTIVAARASKQVDPDIAQTLKDMSSSMAWWGRLAKFGTGDLPYQELISDASNLGERTEAHFYEGTHRLRTGDIAGAIAMFRQVLSTHMVNFFEFTMAQNLNQQISTPR